MKNKLMMGLALAIAASVASTGAMASVLVSQFDKVTFGNGPGANPGGAFNLTNKGPLGNSDLGTFETFCLEFNEYMNWAPNLFTVNSITTEARSGGGGAIGPSGATYDPLGNGTAFLYASFIENQSALSGVTGWSNNGVTSEAEGTAMQLAVWVLEEEISATRNTSYYNNYLANATALGLVGLANQNSNWNNTRVKVLNLVNANGGPAQDQLYLAPVPLPAAGWLMLSALGLGGWFTRRRASKEV